MSKSSIHLQTAKGGTVLHNARENYSKSVVFTDEKNELWNDSKTAFKLFREELEIRTKAYTERTGQKLHKNTSTLISGVVNLEQHHTLEDLIPIKKYLEDKFDTKVIQMSMHRDEGHHKKHSHTEEEQELHDLLKIKNYHGHIEMLGLDSQGNSIRRKLDKPMLRTIQTDAAAILGMERGRHTSYNKDEYFEITKAMPEKEEFASKEEYNKAFKEKAKELGLYKEPKAKRLDTYDYKKAKEMEAEAVARELAKAKDLQELNKKLREELKEQGATREDYAKLEQLNKELKEKIKEKDLTIEELNNIINEYKQDKAPKTNENILNDKSIPEKEKEVLKQFTSDLTTSMQKEIKRELVTVKTGLLKSEDKELNIINEPNSLFKGIQKAFLNQFNVIYELAKEKAKEFYKDIIKSKDTEISELKEKNKELLNSNFTKDKKIEKLEEQNKVLSTGVLQQLSTKQQKENITTTPKAQTLEEILNSNPKETKKDLKDILSSKKIHRDR